MTYFGAVCFSRGFLCPWDFWVRREKEARLVTTGVIPTLSQRGRVRRLSVGLARWAMRVCFGDGREKGVWG